ncbi:Uncharacterized protein WH47_12765 [Habropoda laboriosa]|uniref:Uncharacterized protein n=1 Tax=Habropoda laboriosa TaxID=597456 RepID=A0A0L7R5C9_9HYME|nr:PREDICTED: uncharacterized protein C1orf131-like [Habropoda laboriosa]KOC65966.1 Uncharacterized protein WH47_12765 [Habropoda laboriosa]
MEDFVPTRVSRLKEDAGKEFVSVKYERRQKKKADVDESKKGNEARSSKFVMKADEGNENMDEKKRQELEMKRIRYEVMKFGMSGLKSVEADQAQLALALSLGAKPPKREYINYKVLKDEKMKSKEAEKNKVVLKSGLERSLTKHKTKKPRKKASDGILEVYGKVSKKSSSGKNRK